MLAYKMEWQEFWLFIKPSLKQDYGLLFSKKNSL